MAAIRGHIIHPNPVHADGLAAVILDNHEQRNNAVLIRIQLAERLVRFLGTIVNRGSDRHLFARLMG